MDHREELRQIRAAFTDAPPPADDVPGLDIFEEGNILLIGPDALRFHFVRIVEQSILEPDSHLLDSLVFLLRKANEAHCGYQVSAFDKPQRDSVRMLLQFLKENDDYLGGDRMYVLVERAIRLWDTLG